MTFLLSTCSRSAAVGPGQCARSSRGPCFSLAKAPNKITMLEIIEAVDGPLTGELSLANARGDRYGQRAEQTYNKAIAQAKSVFEKTKLSSLLTGK
jgi:DNA-binding IscR family transcriptional regulator